MGEGEGEGEVEGIDEQWAELQAVSAITTTALNVFARAIGRYIQVMELLPMVCGAAFQGLVQLFEYYLHYVFVAFVEPSVRANLLIGPQKSHWARQWLLVADEMRRISNEISKEGSRDASGGSNSSSKMAASGASVMCMADLSQSSKCFGLASRAIASDSLVFLTQAFDCVRLRALELIPNQMKDECRRFYDKQRVVVYELRALVLASITPQLLPVPIAPLVATVRWDQDKCHTDPSAYVAKALAQLKDLWGRLETLRTSAVLLPSEADFVWAYAYGHTLADLVDGFARTSRKCSAAGRGLMAIDMSALQRGVRDIHPLPRREPPHCRSRKYAQHYVQAFYLDSSEKLLVWMQSRLQVYTQQHMRALAQCCVASQKIRRREIRQLLEQVDALYK